MARICLLTPGQPSSNPRLVKEADALTEAGHHVEVLCGHWAGWATEMDRGLLASRVWSCHYVDGDPITQPTVYYWTRLRHWMSRRVVARWDGNSRLRKWALCRILPELEKAAMRIPADLYIAHYPETLPAAVKAARKHNAKVGFDAEDFHTESLTRANCRSPQDALIEEVESSLLPECDYVTASSPAIAEAYAAKYGIPKPVTILNVFPLSMRPDGFRPTRKDGPLTLYWFSQTIGKDRGLEDAVRAMGALRECKIELHLRGNPAPGYLDELLRLAASVGVGPKQIIVHPPAPPDEMVRLAAHYDVGLALEQNVNQMRSMCLTNKIFTYLLAGNAIAATCTRGQQPVVEAIGQAGFLYRPGDFQMLACQLKRWHDDRELLEEARRQAWDWGTRQYNWDLEKKKFLQVVEAVLNAG